MTPRRTLPNRGNERLGAAARTPLTAADFPSHIAGWASPWEKSEPSNMERSLKILLLTCEDLDWSEYIFQSTCEDLARKEYTFQSTYEDLA